MRKHLIIGSLVSGVFLYLALRNVDWSAFLAAFPGLNYGYLLGGVLFTMIGHYCRAFRWKYIIRPTKDIRIEPLWSATAIAFMVNNLFPARMGEFVRAWTIGRSEDVSKSASFATIVYERILDVFVLIALSWFCLMTIDGPDWLARNALLLVVFNVTLLALVLFMIRRKDTFLRFTIMMTRLLPERFRDRVYYSADAFVNGLRVVSDIRALVPIFATSILVWGFATLGLYCCIVSMNLSLPPTASLFLIAVISIASMIPSAPAFVGPMQYACIVGLAVYGVDKSVALAFSAVYHATQFFPITAAGLYYAGKSHIKLADISSAR